MKLMYKKYEAKSSTNTLKALIAGIVLLKQPCTPAHVLVLQCCSPD